MFLKFNLQLPTVQYTKIIPPTTKLLVKLYYNKNYQRKRSKSQLSTNSVFSILISVFLNFFFPFLFPKGAFSKSVFSNHILSHKILVRWHTVCTQSRPTLSGPTDCRQAPLSMEFSRQDY